jgi:hypothetical protein
MGMGYGTRGPIGTDCDVVIHREWLDGVIETA